MTRMEVACWSCGGLRLPSWIMTDNDGMLHQPVGKRYIIIEQIELRDIVNEERA